MGFCQDCPCTISVLTSAPAETVLLHEVTPLSCSRTSESAPKMQIPSVVIWGEGAFSSLFQTGSACRSCSTVVILVTGIALQVRAHRTLFCMELEEEGEGESQESPKAATLHIASETGKFLQKKQVASHLLRLRKSDPYSSRLGTDVGYSSQRQSHALHLPQVLVMPPQHHCRQSCPSPRLSPCLTQEHRIPCPNPVSLSLSPVPRPSLHVSTYR